MSAGCKQLLRQVEDALRASNARPYDGDGNYKKELVIKTAVVGPSGMGEPGDFVLDAIVPRSAVNDLSLSVHWATNSRVKAAAFLRELATMIEEAAK